jgi:hypothetical protein
MGDGFFSIYNEKLSAADIVKHQIMDVRMKLNGKVGSMALRVVI